ncbi:MAG: hypothetical protein ACKO40_05140 [Planctomycetaceae bacterium]
MPTWTSSTDHVALAPPESTSCVSTEELFSVVVPITVHAMPSSVRGTES